MILSTAVLLIASVNAPVPRDPAVVAGQYLEDRAMRVYACPCEWSTDWAHRGREAVLAWNIEVGSFDGVPLAGLRIAAVLVGDFALTEPDSRRRSALYVDAAAPAHQRDAGLLWLRSTYSALLGTVVATHALPIRFTSDPEASSLAVGSILSLRMRRTHLPEDAESWAELIHDPFIRLASPTVATTLHVSYSGPELNIRWVRNENTMTGYFGAFEALPSLDQPAGHK